MIGIVDLVALCDEQYTTSLGWFVVLGERVGDTTDPELQRLFATAAHRHAWHAELWWQRRPAIPHDVVHEPPAPATIDTGDEASEAYRDHLAEQRALLARLRGELDPDLDPSTLRVVTLVDRDLAELAERLP